MITDYSYRPDMVRGSGLGRRGEASAPTCWKFTASLLQAASKWTIIYFCWSSSMDSLLELDPITLHWKAVFLLSVTSTRPFSKAKASLTWCWWCAAFWHNSL